MISALGPGLCYLQVTEEKAEVQRRPQPEGNRNLQAVLGLPGGPDGKESACNAGDLGSVPGLGRSPGKGSGYPLHYPCLENSVGRGAWWATYSSWGRRARHD